MPIGAATAITAGAAVLGVGAGIYSSSKAAHAQKEASQTAADTSLQVAQQNNEFAQGIYDQNAARLDPYAQRGNAAGNDIMELLLGPAPKPATTIPASSATPRATTTSEYAGHAPGSLTAGVRNDSDLFYQPNSSGRSALRAALSAPSTATPSTPSHPTVATGGTSTNNALSAWNKFRNSTNYQFRLNQGLEGVNTKYAALGAIESGAAMKAVNDYAQNFASNELANYMDQLYRQEALGAQAASSLAGVGTNLVSQVSANNTNAGNAAANAALASGQASANQWGAIGNAVSGAAGTIGGAFASSYHPTPSYDYDALNESGLYDGVWNYG